jgi:hypothetical protein
MVGTTHLIGPTVTPTKGEAGELWAINGNMGNLYLMTVDGLFVATIFADARVPGVRDRVPAAERGVLFNDITAGGEEFWPSINETTDGEVYVVSGVAAGGRLENSNVVHVDGLDTVRRIPASAFTVSPAQRAACWERSVARAAAQVKQNGRQLYRVAITDAAHVADGDLQDWPAAWAKDARPLPPTGKPGDWVSLGELPFHHKWWPIRGAVCVAGDKLHVAITVPRYCLALDGLQAAAADPVDLLAAATAVEIALGTDPAADAARTQPAAGDIRVVISLREGQPLAVLYRAVDPQSTAPPEFVSAGGNTAISSATDISAQVQVGQTQTSYEVAIPLAVLGIDPKPETTLRADFGIAQRPYRVLDTSGCKLRVADGTLDVAGHDERVQQYFWWHNQATTVAEDTAWRPQLWGTWKFERAE